MIGVTFTDVKSYKRINMKLPKNIWQGYFKGMVIPAIIVLCMFTFNPVCKAQTYSIPDSNFRQYLINTFPMIMDGNGDLIIQIGEDSVGNYKLFQPQHKRSKWNTIF